MKNIIKKILCKFGYRIVNIPSIDNQISLVDINGIYLPKISKLRSVGNGIEGMISIETGISLYLLARFQMEIGDVVEIGSWQGRSSSFLISATVQSGNGKFFAIDHFSGNKGKESGYIVNSKDLSDLKKVFKSNMEKAGLESQYELIDEASTLAASRFKDGSIRLLFVDGDHTADGVAADISGFKKKLVEGAIIIFDDYSVNFPELIEVVNNFIGEYKDPSFVLLENSLVVKL